MDANDFKSKLVEEISNCDEILGIGQTGDMNAPLIEGKSDIDLFIICKKVPDDAAFFLHDLSDIYVFG